MILSTRNINILLICISQWKQGPHQGEKSLRTRQNVVIQILLDICKVSTGPLLSIHTFCSIQWFCYQTVKALIRLCICTVWSEPWLSAYDWRHILAGLGSYVVGTYWLCLSMAVLMSFTGMFLRSKKYTSIYVDMPFIQSYTDTVVFHRYVYM